MGALPEKPATKLQRMCLTLRDGEHFGTHEQIAPGAWLRWPVGHADCWPHFQPREFRCHDGSEVMVLDVRLLDGLEELRRLVQAPIHVLSGYRTKDWNAEIGGEVNSQHLVGRAADITVSGLDPSSLKMYAERVQVFREGGIGLYVSKGFVHVDVREGGPARW